VAPMLEGAALEAVVLALVAVAVSVLVPEDAGAEEVEPEKVRYRSLRLPRSWGAITVAKRSA